MAKPVLLQSPPSVYILRIMAEKRFDGKVALVTGASSGIGKATSIALAREGAKVGLTARRAEILKDIASSIEGDGGTAMPIAADVTREEDRKRVVDAAVSTWGGLDILVNAAGIIAFGTIENTSMDAWQEMFDINVVSVFHLTQLALPHLTPRKGNVVIVSSVTGTRSFPGVLAYCASKSAVDQLTRCAALELAEKGVRINAVNPGVVVSNLHRAGGLDEEAYQSFLDHSKSTHPLGRVGNPEEVADLILFLASDQAGWITGATVPIDGGRNLTCAR
jgi:NAD(P)-dependent dehydrogenase (short-subunit alcohol dehydrogenase family)